MSNEHRVFEPVGSIEAAVAVETSIEEAFVGLEVSSDVMTSAIADRENSHAVVEVAMSNSPVALQAIQGSQSMKTRNLGGRRLIHGPDNPIVLDDDDHGSDSSQESAPQRQENRYPGMVQWSSPEYEEEIITIFEEKWMEIQTHWLDMDGMHQAEGTQICAMLDQFNECLEESCDDGRLAQGSAALLLEVWKAFETRVEDFWTDASSTLFRRRTRRFGGLLREFEDMEPLYDAIVEYRGTASDDE